MLSYSEMAMISQNSMLNFWGSENHIPILMSVEDSEPNKTLDIFQEWYPGSIIKFPNLRIEWHELGNLKTLDTRSRSRTRKIFARRIRHSRSLGNLGLCYINNKKRQRHRIIFLKILSYDCFFNRNKSLFDFLWNPLLLSSELSPRKNTTVGRFPRRRLRWSRIGKITVLKVISKLNIFQI